jgi:hypothetical protein
VIAARFSDELVIGLVLGLLVGLLIAPALRSWASWGEWVDASREANRAARESDLFTEVLGLMDAEHRSPPRSQAQDQGAASRVHGSTFRDRWQPQR